MSPRGRLEDFFTLDNVVQRNASGEKTVGAAVDGINSIARENQWRAVAEHSGMCGIMDRVAPL